MSAEILKERFSQLPNVVFVDVKADVTPEGHSRFRCVRFTESNALCTAGFEVLPITYDNLATHDGLVERMAKILDYQIGLAEANINTPVPIPQEVVNPA